MNAGQLKDAACTSNAALAKLAPKVQWEHSYVTGVILLAGKPDRRACSWIAASSSAR
jgi:hypothetical protein